MEEHFTSSSPANTLMCLLPKLLYFKIIFVLVHTAPPPSPYPPVLQKLRGVIYATDFNIISGGPGILVGGGGCLSGGDEIMFRDINI